MKKFLLLFCFALFSLGAFAQVNTLFFKPDEVVNVPLVINSEKYDFLEFDDVTWSIPSSQIITDDSGNKYYHLEECPESWDSGKRDLTLSYSFSINQEEITDTVAVLFVQKKLKDNDLEFSFKDNITDYYVGDTVTVIPRLMNWTDSLDITELYLLSIKDKDTTVLATSEFGDIQFIPEESSKALDIRLGATNKVGSYISTFSWNIKILPTLEIESLEYSTINKDQIITKTEEGVERVEFSVLPGDSVRLVINTNSIESESNLTYTWNVNGQGIQSNQVKTKKNTLSISKFSEELVGEYNCIITNKDSGKIVGTVTFKVSYQHPTANESLTSTNYQVRVENGCVLIQNALNQPILVTNMLGQQIFTGISNSDNFQVQANQKGVLVVKVGSEVFKVLSK